MSADSVNRTFYINDNTRNAVFDYPDNYISTTKYHWYNFLPLALFLQFTRVANVYFLIIAVLQSIPEISPLHPFSAIAPLIIVLAIAMLRDGVEDYFRYKSDVEQNSSKTQVYKNGKFVQVSYHEVLVGEIILVKNNETFPWDIILLNSSNEKGVAYIETASLDGEKNLKTKEASSFSVNQFQPEEPMRLIGMVSCELPNPKLYQFDGSIDVRQKQIPLDKKQLLLQGAILRNTEWILGFVVYTGNDTKLRRNSEERTYKMSQIERQMNKLIIIIILVQFSMCLLLAILRYIWANDLQDDHSYLPDPESPLALSGVLAFFSYFLLLNTMIPISLIVSLELVKISQAFFMTRDINLYSQVRDRPGKVSASSLNEELGMIKHVFTDKTGTLTCNKMDFRYWVIGDRTYGDSSPSTTRRSSFVEKLLSNFDSTLLCKVAFDEPINWPQPMIIQSYDNKTQVQITNQKQLIHLFCKSLALCHEWVIQNTEHGISYNSQSPDEITLVHMASAVGFKLKSLNQGIAQIEIGHPERNGEFDQKQQSEFEIYATLEFDSDRKRCSVVVRDKETGAIWLLTKGADSEILSRTSQNGKMYENKIKEELDHFSRKGLRTLAVGVKLLSDEEFNIWYKSYQDAEKCIGDRKERIDEVSEMLEVDLTIIGVTAVEDRLQDDVPFTIKALQKAGMHIWMLTGDKLETAENIGKTCNLIQDGMVVKRWSVTSAEECRARMMKIKQKVPKNTENLALVVDGTSLEYILHQVDGSQFDDSKIIPLHTDTEQINACNISQSIFIEMSKFAKTVIWCRVTPGQKRDVVKLMKKAFQTITLSVGDGANDVSMLLEAHIGVGIYGEEGMQAIQASDYALGEFKFLYRLLLVHGRWNYIRQSELIQYFFYKNLVFTIPQFYFAFLCAFSGQTVYDDWYITFYNLVFTGLPLIVRAIYERDIEIYEHKKKVSDEIEYMKFDMWKNFYPATYHVGQNNLIFTKMNFLNWWLTGIIHAGIAFAIPIVAFNSGILDGSGYSNDIWSVSITSFTCVIIMVTLKLCMNTRLWNVFIVISIFIISILAYFGFMVIYDNIQMTPAYQTVDYLILTPIFWLWIILWVSLVFVFDEAMHIYKACFQPTYSEQLHQVSIRGKGFDYRQPTTVDAETPRATDSLEGTPSKEF